MAARKQTYIDLIESEFCTIVSTASEDYEYVRVYYSGHSDKRPHVRHWFDQLRLCVLEVPYPQPHVLLLLSGNHLDLHSSWIRVDSRGGRAVPRRTWIYQGGGGVAVNTSGRIELGVNATNGYAGYHFSFGTAHAPNGSYYAYGYKTNFASSVGTFGSVTLPLQRFINSWEAAAGDAIKTCQDDAISYPYASTLNDMRTLPI